MLTWLDTGWIRAGAYLAAAVGAFAAGWVDQRSKRSVASAWPAFWFLTGGLLLLMAFVRATGLTDDLTSIGRDQAIAAGWYANRRPAQAVVVALLALGYLVFVVLSLWWVPERRRRYLPITLLVLTLGCFGAIRTVSLHQVDALVHRRHVAGAEVGVVIEQVLLAAILLSTIWLATSSLAEPSPSRHVAG